MFNIIGILRYCLLLAVFLPLSSITAIAQEDFASLRKNVNYRAKMLHHELNASKDTLILRSPNRMYRLYSVGDCKSKIDEKIDDFEYRFPLRQLKIGRYLMVTQFNGVKVVFELNILQREAFSQSVVSQLVTANVTANDFNLDVSTADVTIKEPVTVYRPYNLTDLDRRGMQSRDDCRRLMALERERIKAEMKKRRLLAMNHP